MHISDLHDYDGDKHQHVAQPYLDQDTQARVKADIERIVDEEFDRLEDYAGEYISRVAADRATKFLERLLKGDEEAAKQLLGVAWGYNGRHDTYGPNAGRPIPNMIHGRLFEGNMIELRRKLVESNADLIRNERIADLEAVVEGLSEQVRRLERELEETRDRLR